MLVISRKEGESFLIGDGIRVTISDLRGSQVRVSIEAPREILILREEIAQADENEMAAASGL